jgi:hypothetical protein
VTLALQNLRTVVGADEFDAWYQPHLERMKADDLFAWFHDLRNEILKEGPPATMSNAHIEFLGPEEKRRLMANPPPGAIGFFVGDPLGGSGWSVEAEDGTTEKFYVTLPDDLRVRTWLTLPDQPDTAVPIVKDASRHFSA